MNDHLISTIDTVLHELFDEYEHGPEANRATTRTAIPLMWRARMAAHAGAPVIAEKLCNETASLLEQHTLRRLCIA